MSEAMASFLSLAPPPLRAEHRHGVLSEERDTESQARLPPPYEGERVGAIHNRLVGNSLVIYPDLYLAHQSLLWTLIH